MKKVHASYYTSLNCECPHCGDYLDLLALKEYYGKDYWECLELLKSENNVDLEYECPNCSEKFILDSTEW